METLTYLLMPLVNLQLLGLIALGTFAGIYIGAIPGLSVTMAVSVLISFTFAWEVNSALALMVGIFVGGVYGGARTAIFLNIPGAPAAIATALDGYPLAQRGEAGQALGISTLASVVGGFIGVAILVVGGPAVSEIALLFAPRDYMLLAVMGLLLVGSLSPGSTLKGVFAGALGVMIGMVGLDPMTAEGRFTFDYVYLMGGVPFVAVMIGIFGVAEALYQLRDVSVVPIKQKVDKIIPSWTILKRFIPLTIRTSVIGTAIGALPGVGGDIAALLSYDHAKRSTKNPSRPFGQGAYEGLIAPEASNNAAIGGTFIPMLTLGIPGDAVTAIIIGALYIHGLNPGPLLMIERPHIFWFIVGSLVLANIFLLVFGLTGIKAFAKIVEVPKAILMPLIIVFSAVGTYAIQNNITDVYWMLGLGVFGYFMKLYDYPVGPVILGVILGPLIDVSYRRAMISVRSDVSSFLLDLVTNPISLVLTAAIIFLLISESAFWKRSMQRLAARGADPNRG